MTTSSTSDYVLGHSPKELERLKRQGAMTKPITRDFLVAAGLTHGMRVLDVGCGAGDVTFLASDLVGDAGEVVGVDRAPEAVGLARGRASSRGIGNVSFELGEAETLKIDSPFDAVIGRYVLQFQPEPSRTLERLRAHLRPGGLVVFHESDWTTYASIPAVPIWDRCGRLAVEALRAGGAETQTGTKLPAIFARAGLAATSMRMITIVGPSANCTYACTRAVDLVLTLLPSMERFGLVAPGELDPHTLLQEVIDDVSVVGGVVIGWSEVAAWARV